MIDTVIMEYFTHVGAQVVDFRDLEYGSWLVFLKIGRPSSINRDWGFKVCL